MEMCAKAYNKIRVCMYTRVYNELSIARLEYLYWLELKLNLGINL